ncbi:MAG TPA: septal ring lytic transglycosylase RlpA family protein [Stellaceae bacterium]|nr:septal ring lytic transglycosylase RlpA family protein [Stellaceae bacterium]
MKAARRLRRGAPAALALFLAACAGGSHYGVALSSGRSAGGEGYYRVGAPYEVNGVWYYPAVDYGYDRTGVASWYGPGYDGRLTANGEIFDMNGLSAAHPTLPLPSIVRVTNLANGRSLDLRVNDRGPFVDGRILDVSRHAAELLGFESTGITPVRVRILKRRSIEVAELAKEGIIANGPAFAEASPSVAPAPLARVASAAPPPAPSPAPPRIETPAPAPVVAPAYPAAAAPPPESERAAIAAPPLRRDVSLAAYRPRPPARPAVAPAALAPPGRMFVQAGAFAVPANAWRVRARIAGLATVRVSAVTINGATIYRVRLGPFASVEQANRVLSRVVGGGYAGARLVFE